MHVIKGDQIIAANGWAVAPRPSNGDAGIKEIVDQIVRDAVVRRLADPDSDRAGEKLASIMDMAIADLIGASLVIRLVGDWSANFQATGAKIGKLAMTDDVARTTAFEFQAISAEVRKGAVLERASSNALSPNCTGYADGRLGKSAGLICWGRRIARLTSATFEIGEKIPF